MQPTNTLSMNRWSSVGCHEIAVCKSLTISIATAMVLHASERLTNCNLCLGGSIPMIKHLELFVFKIRKYRDYNNNPPNSISFIPAIVSTSGSLHSELVCLLFLQVHRETDRFFAASGVQVA